MSEDTGVPYQRLINLYLRDCPAHHKKLIYRGNVSHNKCISGLCLFTQLVFHTII